jgi:hypothetical protein
MDVIKDGYVPSAPARSVTVPFHLWGHPAMTWARSSLGRPLWACSPSQHGSAGYVKTVMIDGQRALHSSSTAT